MRLLLNKVPLYVTLGVRSWEKVIKRLVWVNVSLSSKTLIDYSMIIDCMTSSVIDRQFNYIEDLTEEFLLILIDQFAPIKLSIEVIKPSLSRFLESASVRCEYNSEITD